MSNTNTAPLMESAHVKEFIAIMDANNLPETVHLLNVIAYVGEMEKQLGVAVEQLAAMRQELAVMREESHPFKTAMQNAVKTLEANIAAMRERLSELKQNIIDGCKNAVAAFKDKGLSALRNIAEFFHLRPGLEALRDNLDKSIKNDEAAMVKIEAVSAEYHEAGRHLKNMSRAVRGKEAVAEARAPGKLAAALKAPFKAERACFVAARRCVNAAIGAVARLEKTERKPPIMDTLKKFDEQIAQAKKDAPATDRPRPVTHDGR